MLTRSRLQAGCAPITLAWAVVTLGTLHPGRGHAQGLALDVVRPMESCDALSHTNLNTIVGAAVSITTATVDTPQGSFCHVTGNIAPTIGFEVDLPETKWTQRFIEAGCGGLCGNIHASIGNAGNCQPALNGEFVVAADDLGHESQMASPTEGDFAADPQKRIDFAYRGNHLTTVVAKALIKAFYGHAPRYSYFSGCSDGGREGMMEAERYPGDFNGISAGAPAMLFQVQNSFYHAWTVAANTRPDGTHILLSDKLPVLHAAVIAHCDALDGNTDGLLSDPRACTVQADWVKCRDGTNDTSKCLTAAEWAVVAKIYQGPTDAEGHKFLTGGLQPGSEAQWFAFVPREATGAQMSTRMVASMSNVVLPDKTQADAEAATYAFTTAQFARVSALHPLNDATSTNLRPFAAHGGRLIMWHGWSDSSIAPMISVAYYKALRAEIGADAADRFVRLFMIPGVGHCGGGDGFAQVDTLNALMDWVEKGTAPTMIVADKVPERMMPGGPPHPQNSADGRSGPPGAPATPAKSGQMAQSGPGGVQPMAPYARPDEASLGSRPIYPFPMIARYNGAGDPKLASSYGPAPSPVADDAGTIDWYGAHMLAPDFQKTYRVKNGKLTLASVR